ncbi:YhhA family cyclophane-containing RiPP [Novacetimonas pomaceti]|uniref:YhhA family cyclophane-containing RiPP n=1 Tax=Novacetimonas pomaceti TaxID=2021998 RepID=UPI0026D3582A
MYDVLPKQEFRNTEEAVTLDVSLDSPAIRRLVEEVRAELYEVPRSYNRTFNRHNR